MKTDEHLFDPEPNGEVERQSPLWVSWWWIVGVALAVGVVAGIVAAGFLF